MIKNLYLLILTVLLIFSCSSENESPEPPCLAPVIELDEITLTEAVFSRTSSNPIQVEYGTEGFALGTGTIIDVLDNIFSVTGLLPFKSYDLYAKTICPSLNSEWFGPLNFVTQCDVNNGVFNGVFLDNQAEVDAFGALCYSEVNGVLRIGTSLNNDIILLSNINSVTIDILIVGTQLTSLKGINITENLPILQVVSNNSLINLEGINLTDTIEILNVEGNSSLESLVGLEELNSITTNLRIENCNNFSSFNGLNNLEDLLFGDFIEKIVEYPFNVH
ncbi:hypothetical protein [Lacinutrix sp.]|uniref:hypothetical protein n=1 Tax=Lacinutrix sp. TaxID=1937692 RepID=UPI0025C20619|nr:hypothetical protein [Lacinutrix sp.]